MFQKRDDTSLLNKICKSRRKEQVTFQKANHNTGSLFNVVHYTIAMSRSIVMQYKQAVPVPLKHIAEPFRNSEHALSDAQ